MRLQLKKRRINRQFIARHEYNGNYRCSEGDVRNLSVPGGAILRENGRTSIFLYDASSHAIRRCDVTVTRLLSDGRCLITSDGANPGDLVVASGVHHVKEGEQVEPLLPAAETNVGGLL